MNIQKPVNFLYENDSNEVQHATININSQTTTILKQDLVNIKFCLMFLKINNLQIPSFIPENVHYQNQSYLTPNTGCPNSVINGNMLTVNSLKYFVILRKVDNSALYMVYLNHEQCNFSVYFPPPSQIQSGEQYLRNKYYWYPNINYFIRVVNTAISQCMQYSGSGLNYLLKLQNDNSVVLETDNMSGDWMLEFSSTLTQIFGFDYTQSPFMPGSYIISNWVANDNTNIVSGDFYSDSLTYTSIMFKVDNDNIPLSSEEFIVSGKNAFTKQKIIYNLHVGDIQPFNKNILTYNNTGNKNDLSIWRSFVSNVDTDFEMNIRLYYIIHRDSQLYEMPYLIGPNEKIEASFLFVNE